MKVLFDECIPSLLRPLVPDCEIKTAQQMGWGRVKNGDLLRRAEGVFYSFVTADKNLKYQQNLKGRSLAILQLPTNHWPTLKPHAAFIARAIHNLKPGDYIELELPKS